MNKTLILQLNRHNVYFVSDNNISFYISIPTYSEYKSVNISIDIKDNFDKINPNTNDMIYVKDELFNIYGDIDRENVTLIVPVFHNDILERIKNGATEKLYAYLDKCISYIINNAYKLLVSESISVNSKIVIVKNDRFTGFIDWFSSRYSSRVDAMHFSELIGDFTSVIPVISTNSIVDIPTEKSSEDEGNITVKEGKNTGFISYVLLGAFGIVITLIFLYKLL